MRLLSGTSGYSYKAWKGNFYPSDLPASRMLEHYCSKLPAVEVNNTFYRMPSAKMVQAWTEASPEPFRFVLKASRRITHHARLHEVDDLLRYLFDTTLPLGPRLGAHLFQLPPYAKIDLGRLDAFLQRIPSGQRVALEFRHHSWFADEVFDLLRRHDAALVIADGGKIEVPFVPTAGWGYLRLRRDNYDDEAMAGWVQRVLDTGWSEAFVFFKHEDEGAGPRMARQFLDLATGSQG